MESLIWVYKWHAVTASMDSALAGHWVAANQWRPGVPGSVQQVRCIDCMLHYLCMLIVTVGDGGLVKRRTWMLCIVYSAVPSFKGWRSRTWMLYTALQSKLLKSWMLSGGAVQADRGRCFGKAWMEKLEFRAFTTQWRPN